MLWTKVAARLTCWQLCWPWASPGMFRATRSSSRSRVDKLAELMGSYPGGSCFSRPGRCSPWLGGVYVERSLRKEFLEMDGPG